MEEDKLDQQKANHSKTGSQGDATGADGKATPVDGATDGQTDGPGDRSTDAPNDGIDLGLLFDDELIATGDILGAQERSQEQPVAGMDEMREEVEQARDSVLRAQADAQNTRRRAEQDVEKARKFALERFSAELLPVVDNLERAMEAARVDDPAVKSIADGVELTLKSFTDALKKFQIEVVDPAGEPFDPKLHQAISMVENPDAEPNTVLAVMQKGYTLNGRLLRPAMVMVSKAPSA